jgi:GNAT superfamily N-acetyltransferase
VTRATVDDVPALVPLFEAYRAFYRSKPDAETATAFLRERLAKNESVIFCARTEPKGPPVGFAQLYPLFSSVRLCRSWLLNDLYVVPEARRGGVAAAIIARAEELARETNAGLLELSTHQSNRSAQRVYSGAGWSRDDDYYHYSKAIARR